MDKQPEKQVANLTFGARAAFDFGFWIVLGGTAAFGVMLSVHRLVRLGWPMLRTWLGL